MEAKRGEAEPTTKQSVPPKELYEKAKALAKSLTYDDATYLLGHLKEQISINVRS